MNVYGLAMTFSALFMIGTIELIRRRKMDERYALLWLALSFSMLVFNGYPDLLPALARAVKVAYAPSLLFLIGMFFSLLFIMHLTVTQSALHRRLVRLTQELALLQSDRSQQEEECRTDEGGAGRQSAPIE